MEQTIKIVRSGLIFQISPIDPRHIGPRGQRRYLGGGGSMSPEQVPKYTPEQMELLKSLIGGQLLPQMGEGITPYGGERVAGATPLQESAYGMAGGYAPGVQAGLQGFGQYDPTQAGQFMGMGQQGLSDIMQPYDPTSAQESWQANMRPAFNMWRDEVMPAIQERGVSMTGSGDAGGIGRELARSGKDLTTNMASMLASQLYGGEQAHLGRQQTGIGQTMGMAQMPGQLAGMNQQLAAMGLGQMAGMGGEQRGIGQQFLGAEQAQWAEAQPYQNPWLQFLPTALGASAFDTVVGQEGPSGASQMAPYALAAAMAAPSMQAAGGLLPLLFSDIRVKENIKPIDSALDKVSRLTGYSYNYKFNSPDNRNGGVMAQDLEEVLPDAVSEINGMKFVRYDAVVALLVQAINELNPRRN